MEYQVSGRQAGGRVVTRGLGFEPHSIRVRQQRRVQRSLRLGAETSWSPGVGTGARKLGLGRRIWEFRGWRCSALDLEGVPIARTKKSSASSGVLVFQLKSPGFRRWRSKYLGMGGRQESGAMALGQESGK